MADLATLTLSIDSTQVKTGTAALDGLTAAGVRAEAMAGRLKTSTKAAAAEATSMAAAAQAAARAAVEQGAGFTKAANAAHLNTMAMRESLVVAREISRGNFTRLPGSLTLLAQGVSSQGGLTAFAAALANTLGLVKTVQNAELAEEATLAQNAATALRAAAQRAGANILAADTELALADAQARVAVGAAASAAAQARLGAAHQAASAAAAEATIAENALAIAEARAGEAGAAASAETSLALGPVGIALAAAAAAAGGVYLAFETLGKSSSVSAQTLSDLKNATETETGAAVNLKQAIDELHNSTVKETQSARSAALESISVAESYRMRAINARKAAVAELELANAKASSANISGTYEVGIGGVADELAQKKRSEQQAKIAGLNAEIAKDSSTIRLQQGALTREGIEAQLDPVTAATARFSAAQDKLNTQLANGKISLAAYATQFKALRVEEDKETDAARASQHTPRHRHPRAANDHGIGQELAKLDQQIAGQQKLAASYLISEVAAFKAEAEEKALAQALQHHASAAQTTALIHKELAIAVANDLVAGAKQVANLRDETAARDKVNKMVESGVIPASQAAEQMKLEVELRPHLIALANATGKAREDELNIIRQLTDAQAALNAEDAHSNALAAIAAKNADIARLKMENSLTGMGSKASSIAMAAYDAQQEANRRQYNPQDAATLVEQAQQLAALRFKSPFDQWLQGAADTQDALENIKVRGLDGIVTGMADVASGTKSLGQAFSELARNVINEIIQMTIRMLIFRLVSGIAGSLGGGGASVQSVQTSGSIPAFNPSLVAAKGAAIMGGRLLPFATGGVVSSPTMFPMAGGNTGLMGEAGPEAIMPLGRDGSGRLGVRAANNNAPVEVHVVVTASPELDVKIEQKATSVVLNAAPGLVKASVQATMAQAGRRPLMGH